jgi:hypothetical protein
VGKGSGMKGKGAAKKAAAGGAGDSLANAGLDAQVDALMAEARDLRSKEPGATRVYLDDLQERLAARGMTLDQMVEAVLEGGDSGRFTIVQNDIGTDILKRPSLSREKRAIESALARRVSARIFGRERGWIAW